MLQMESSGSSSGRPVTSAKTRLYKNLAVLLLDPQFRLILTHLFTNLATTISMHTYPYISHIYTFAIRLFFDLVSASVPICNTSTCICVKLARVRFWKQHIQASAHAAASNLPQLVDMKIYEVASCQCINKLHHRKSEKKAICLDAEVWGMIQWFNHSIQFFSKWLNLSIADALKASQLFALPSRWIEIMPWRPQ